MKRVLVTGASGFIGGSVARTLVDSGCAVTAQYRRESPTALLAELEKRGALLVRADLTKDVLDPRLTEGIDAVVHAAAYVRMTGRYEDFHAVNRGAVERLLQRAAGAGCKQFVYISSISVHGFARHIDSDELGPFFPLKTPYQISKRAGENAVTGFVHETMSWTVIRPGLVYGPGDTTTLKPVFELLDKGKMPAIGGFRVYNCPVYIDDLVQAVILAVEKPEARGQVFDLVSGEKVLLRDAVWKAAELLGRPGPKRDLPAWLAFAAAAVLEAAYRIFGIKGDPLITRYLAAELSRDFHFNPDKAERILGFKARVSWREGLEKAVDAYKRSVRV